MKPLGGDSKTQDGIASSLSILDEYHAFVNDGVKENLESSMAARKQPLVYTITTAGSNIVGVCKNFEEQCEAILDEQLKDDHFFIMIHDLDDGDDWQVVENWDKANPNLHVTVSLDFLKKEYQKALNQPSKIPNFKTKHLNQWVDAPEIWIPTEIWTANKTKTKDYEALFLSKAQEFGSYCAVDLSTITDITAVVWVTKPDAEGNMYINPFFLCPKDTIDKRSKEDRVPYRYWVDTNLMIATPGNTVDYAYVKKLILQKTMLYNTQCIEFDQWNAEQLRNEIAEHGIETSYFSQAIGVISYPTKQFEKFVYEGTLKHSGNKVLTWMLSGCVIYPDANENIKVHKGKSHMGKKRVDGIIATIMALGGMLSVEDISEQSQYNNPETPITFGINN